MKKCIILFGFVLLIVGELFAQSSNNEQRLVGTWTDLHGGNFSLVFNADGTMSVRGNVSFNGFVPTHWAAAGDKLLVFILGSSRERAIRYFNISSDGRTLIISTIAVEGTGGTGSIGTAYRRN